MNSITIQHNQNLFDVSVQATGSIEGIFDICAKNGIASITDMPVNGAVLEYDKNEIEPRVLANYARKVIIPATSDVDSTVTPLLEGISVWSIEVDFVVS